MPDAIKKQSSRIIALDLMRGYFLLCVVIDHLNYWPNGLDWLSARGELFVSSAEGFFLISGIVLGIVRGSKLVNKPFRLPAWLLLKRGFQLYGVSVLLVLFFTLVGWLFLANPGLKYGIAPSDTPLLKLVWDTLTLQYLYGWADYLRLYALFLFVSPLVMWLLRKNKWWIILATSAAVWLFSPNTVYPESLFVQPYKWQLIFFGGMIIGFHWQQLAAQWARIPTIWRGTTISLLLATAAVTLLGNLVLAFGGYISHDVFLAVAPIRDYLHEHYFDKEMLQWPRLALFMVWFWASFWLFRKFEAQITRFVGKVLLPFGTNSLYVYIVHAFILFFIHLVVPPGNKVFAVNVLLSWGVLAIIWLMIRRKLLFTIIPR